MTYSAIQSDHYGRVFGAAATRIRQHPQEAEKVHRACLAAVGNLTAIRSAKRPKMLEARVKQTLGLGGIQGWIAALIGGIAKQLLLQLLMDLLPQVIAWLQEQLGSLVGVSEGPHPLDRMCADLAVEGT